MFGLLFIVFAVAVLYGLCKCAYLFYCGTLPASDPRRQKAGRKLRAAAAIKAGSHMTPKEHREQQLKHS